MPVHIITICLHLTHIVGTGVYVDLTPCVGSVRGLQSSQNLQIGLPTICWDLWSDLRKNEDQGIIFYVGTVLQAVW